MAIPGAGARGSSTSTTANVLFVFVVLLGAGTGGLYVFGTGWFPTAPPSTAFSLSVDDGTSDGLADPDGPAGDAERLLLVVDAGESVDTDRLRLSVDGERVAPPGANASVRFAGPLPETLDAGDRLAIESGRSGDHLAAGTRVRVVYSSWWSDRSVVVFETTVD